jgi:hypothetical protein
MAVRRYSARRSTAPVAGLTRAAAGLRLTRTANAPVTGASLAARRARALPPRPAATVCT